MSQQKPQGSESNQSLLYVKKYGGTSVGSIERIEAIADQIVTGHLAGERQIIVLSAMAGETNRLIALSSQIDPIGDPRERDMLISTGEQISIALMAMALQKRGVKAKSLTGDQVQVHTNSHFGRASIERVDTAYLDSLLAEGVIPVVAGFQGRNADGDVTTLGRGGSDTTAVAIAAAFEATECQIYTDVAGVFTTDPNIESTARRLSNISFAAMYQMARLGAKVLHPDSVAYAEKFSVPLRVLSSFEFGEGTLISDDNTILFNSSISKSNVVGIAVTRDLAMISLQNSNNAEYYSQLFNRLTEVGIEVDSLTKTQADNGVINFTIDKSWLNIVLSELDLFNNQVNTDPIYYSSDLVRVSLVGNKSLVKSDVVSKMFNVLGELGINVELVSVTDLKVALVIQSLHLNVAVKALHLAFGLNKL